MKFIYSSFQSKVSESAESVKNTHCHYMKFNTLQTVLGRHPMRGGRRGGVLPTMAFTGSLHLKGVSFSGYRYNMTYIEQC